MGTWVCLAYCLAPKRNLVGGVRRSGLVPDYRFGRVREWNLSECEGLPTRVLYVL